MRAPAGFEQDLMKQRTILVGAALASIIAGIAAFVIGLRQPTELRASTPDTFEIATRR